MVRQTYKDSRFDILSTFYTFVTCCLCAKGGWIQYECISVFMTNQRSSCIHWARTQSANVYICVMYLSGIYMSENKPYRSTIEHAKIYSWHATVVCSALQCVAVRCSVLQCVAVRCSVLQCVAMCCSVLQCFALCCSVLQCIAVYCSVSQCVTASTCLLIPRSSNPDSTS